MLNLVGHYDVTKYEGEKIVGAVLQDYVEISQNSFRTK